MVAIALPRPRLDLGVHPAPLYCPRCECDWSRQNVSGGLLVGLDALCPACAPRVQQALAARDELWLIRDVCPEDMTYAQWRLSQAATERLE